MTAPFNPAQSMPKDVDPQAEAQARSKGKGNGKVPPPIPEITDSATLDIATFTEPKFVVPGYVTEGLVILAGRPKIGKSWLALGLADAVARGGRAFGQLEVEAGDVLYLALEDIPRRLQKRMRVIVLLLVV